MSENGQVRVCVPVCARRAGELREAVARAAQLADVIELRLDCLDESELEAAKPSVVAALAEHSQEFILTLRPSEQGGRRALDARARMTFWLDETFKHVGPRTLFDIELDLATIGKEEEKEKEKNERREEQRAPEERTAEREFRRWLSRNWHRVVCSQHDFSSGAAARVSEIYERMASTPARILKLAFQADTATDCIPVFRLLERARRERRELIAVAMGAAGIMTRVLAPSRGAYLTFASLGDDQQTAPGQLNAAELRDLYRVGSITERTAVTGLVGSPVAHSLSPHMHNAAYAARGCDAVYIPFEVSDAGEFVRRMARPPTREVEWNLRGLSVTAPHKSAIMPHLDRIDPAARDIGAVNTVVIEGDELRGYNTDAAAALVPLDNLIDLRGARVAVIGAGGAARALLWALRARGALSTVFARDAGRAHAVAQNFGASASPLDSALFSDFDVVINATPLGTRAHAEDQTPATAEQLRGARVVYDLVYNPSETLLMREARAAGCAAVGGLQMLVAQAAAQFKLWTGLEAPLEVMRRAAEKQMLDVGC